MDKVDARTRETAVTLLDVLWTANAAGKTAKSSTVLAENAANQPPAKAVNSVGGLSSQVGRNIGVLGTVPTKTALRHGFDTNGWGNDAAVQVSTQATPVSAKSTINKLENREGETSQPHKPENDIQTKSQQQEQQQQPQSSTAVASSSSASVVPTIAVQNEEHERQNQQKRFEQQQQHMEQNQKPSEKLKQSSFHGANSSNTTTTTTSGATAPMTISMTSVGFGIDNNNTSRVDATEATIKAVKDAIDRSTLRFHTFHSHSLQIKIQLGVPCVASPLGKNDSKVTQMQLMKIDRARLLSILPRIIPILPVQVEPGGLFVPGETPGAPSICTVVACITLESQPQPSPSKPQSQPQPSPQRSVAPPLPPRPPLTFDSSTTTGLPNPKQALAMTSASTSNISARITHAPAHIQETQHHLQSSAQIQYQSVNPLPTPSPTVTQGHPIHPQQWDRANFPNKNSSETAPLPSSSLLYRAQVGARAETQIEASGKSNLREANTTLASNEHNVAGSTAGVGDKGKLQCQQNNGGNQKVPMQVDEQENNRTTNSIEILAMISEQEINRRSILGANGSSTASSTPSSRVFSSVAPSNGGNNTTIFQNGQISSSHFATPGVANKNGPENPTANSTTSSSNLRNSPGARQPLDVKGRPGNKLGRSRGGRSISYSDYSNELPLPEERDCWALSTRTTSSPVFPLKLHETLTQIEKDGYDDIIGWLPHGRSFKIHKQKEFTSIILPRYFVMTKKSSFLRQLNLYSFNRFSAGTTDKGSYYHEKFLRGKKFLSRRMTRQKVNGNRIRSAGNPDEEPDLSLYPICRENDSNGKQHLPLSSTSSASHSLITTSGATIVSTGDIPLSSSTPTSQSTMIHTTPAPATSDPSVGSTINRRNAVGASSFLRVL